jgi:hypothetical protein
MAELRREFDTSTRPATRSFIVIRNAVYKVELTEAAALSLCSPASFSGGELPEGENA